MYDISVYLLLWTTNIYLHKSFFSGKINNCFSELDFALMEPFFPTISFQNHRFCPSFLTWSWQISGPKTVVPLLKRPQGLGKLLLSEIRPKSPGEEQLCISHLPKQEVTDPDFPTSPDKKIRVRKLSTLGLQFSLNQLLIDIFDLYETVFHLLRDTPTCFCNVILAAVTS